MQPTKCKSRVVNSVEVGFELVYGVEVADGIQRKNFFPNYEFLGVALVLAKYG